MIGDRAGKTDSASFPAIPIETDWERRRGRGATGVEKVSGAKVAEAEEEATEAEAYDEMLGLIHA